MFEDEVIKALKSRDLTDASIATHIKRLKALKPIEVENLSFLQDTKTVSTRLEGSDLKVTSIKGYYTSIRAVVKNNKMFTPAAQQFYMDRMMHYINLDKDRREKNNKMTQYEKDNWIEVEELKAIYKRPLKKIKFCGDKFINWRLRQEVVTFLFYGWRLPFRLDLADAFIIKSDKYLDIKGKRNYIVFSEKNKKGWIILNHFKTIRSMGRKVFPIQTFIIPHLAKWFKIIREVASKYRISTKLLIDEDPKVEYNSDTIHVYPLFYSMSSINRITPYSKGGFGLYVTRLYKKYTGKSMTVRLLRVIYETHHFHSEDYKNYSSYKKKKLHEQLLHSTSISSAYNRATESKR